MEFFFKGIYGEGRLSILVFAFAGSICDLCKVLKVVDGMNCSGGFSDHDAIEEGGTFAFQHANDSFHHGRFTKIEQSN